jgi:ABC-type glycerol-3-phosphate transport system substrate-binding protein
MSKKMSALLMVMMAAVVVLSGCSASFGQAAEKSAAEAASTVEQFYRWYLGYPGNPFAERAYRDSPLLSEAFKAELDAEMDAMIAAGPGGADLILCAQDIPGEMRYGAAEVEGDSATATVTQVWNPGTEFEMLRDQTVTLEQVDGKWLIGGISCPAR